MKSLIARAVALWSALEKNVFDRLQGPLLFVLRFWWGWSFFTGGKTKLENIEGIVTYFDQLHIPFPAANAWFVSSLETVGGLLLMAGLFSRPVAALLSANMTVAYLTADRDKVLHIFQDPDKFIAADPFHFLLVSLLVLAFGPGWISLDALIARLRRAKGPAPAAARSAA
jgi:putative oxidoreductase